MILNFKCIGIVILIICLLATVMTADARHYSTLNHNQHVIHPVQHHSYFNGNPPPNRNPISDQEVQGVGRHYLDDQRNE